MKITQDDYTRFERLIHATLDRYPNIESKYSEAGKSKTRFYFDTFHVTTDYLQLHDVESYLFMRGLYDYLQDDNLETTLKHAVKSYNEQVKVL